MSFEKIGDIRVSQLGITGNIYTHLCDDLDILTIDKRTFISAERWFIRVPVLDLDLRFGVLFEGYGTEHLRSEKCVGVITKTGDYLEDYLYYGEGNLAQVLEDYTGRKDVGVMQCEVWNYEW